ncbi:Sugar transferase involved in LPS biosynthesis (colanic, teichoic acid) [Tessaracoccus bendigoensis DSM 12906]|uniref:Sugar transferase involved in LPS biosynthesis (Colanic, teichoic acid) n=1 Tax=Tessaracoccus bendigoensis DSM 12906 TaxID=1123357 RepID=A0A1M6K7U8_9ACTN|nr:sugar transferase [Tessaracoccus bendigoensis]SHJ54983.1 Sugar transferase involved in LPS biosynthesis (colanic, teichoic acid) [Tessaracoccus bendigoensis DSM 12906]
MTAQDPRHDSTGRRPAVGLALKRLIDVVASGAVLLLIWPVLLIIALWVRLDSRGPALFRQVRVGKGMENFRILKFRTMTHRPNPTTEQAHQQVITEGADPRITRAGRFLRSSSLDELPQLINILRGDMSLIGPRPIIPAQLAAMPTQRMDRFEVRPGLTGLAQTRGRRGLDWLKQLGYDSEYVRTRSLWLDIRIVVATVKVVLTGSGVYGGEGSNWRAHLTPATPGPERAEQ